MIIGINGRFLTARATGVQRWSFQVIERLLHRAETVLFLPRSATPPEAWQTTVVRGRLGGHAWEQLELRRTAPAHCDVLFNPANSAPLAAHCQIVMIHDVFPLVHPEWYSRSFAQWFSFLVPRMARNADVLLTSTRHMAELIEATTGAAAARIVVAAQGAAPFDRPATAAAVERFRRELGITEPYALAVGDGDPRKNVAYAVDVVHRYRLRYGTAPVLVVAGGSNQRVHGRHADADVPHGIRAGYLSDDALHAAYTGAAALLYPSLDEGYGRPPIEALCCGTPALVADHASAAEVLDGSPARRLPLDKGAWVAALHNALHTPRHSADVRTALATRWSWDAAVDAVLAASATALQHRAERRRT